MIILFMLAHVPLIVKCCSSCHDSNNMSNNIATVKGADSLTSLSINEFKSCATLWTDVQYSVLPCTDSCRLCALIIQPWTDEPHCALMFHVLWWFSRELMSRIVLWCSICSAGVETSGQMRNQILHAVVTGSTFGSKKCQHTWRSVQFGSWDVEKVHAVVARSTFGSEHVQSTSAPDHFWQLRCGKSARYCGAKRVWK